MRRVLAVILIFVSVAGCSVAPAPQVLHPQYRYVASYAPGPFAPGAAFHVDWTPELIRTDSGDPYDVRLCIAVFGPFENASALKESGSRSSGTRPDCPPAGAVVSSGALRTRSDTGKPLAADLVLPRGSGLYDLREIVVNGVEPTSSATSAGGVIEVRGP